VAPDEDVITRRSPAARAVLASTMPAVDLCRVRTGELELDELLGGGIAVGSAVLVYGKRGSGKTRLTYRWATRAPCLVVCPELSLDVARIIVQSTGGHLETAYLLQTLEGWQEEAERLGVRSLVIDSLAAARNPTTLLRSLQIWARSHGAIAWAIQHATKKGDHRGDTSVSHWSDYEMRLSKPTPTASSTRVELLKTRIGPTGIATAQLI
jgi:predicted ATP-dependent serine protease